MSTNDSCAFVPVVELMKQARETGNIDLQNQIIQIVTNSNKKIVTITDVASVVSLVSYIEDKILELCIPCCAQSKIINAINDYMLKQGFIDMTSTNLFDNNTMSGTVYIDDTVISLLINVKHIIQMLFGTVCCCSGCNYEKNRWKKTSFKSACEKIFGDICII